MSFIQSVLYQRFHCTCGRSSIDSCTCTLYIPHIYIIYTYSSAYSRNRCSVFNSVIKQHHSHLCSKNNTVLGCVVSGWYVMMMLKSQQSLDRVCFKLASSHQQGIHNRLSGTLHVLHTHVHAHQGFIWRLYFGGGNMVDNFKDSKKGHNTPVGAFATSQL